MAKKKQLKVKQTIWQITLNQNAFIAAVLNLILVGLGYVYLKRYLRAVLSFIVYIMAYVIIFYLATFVPILIWIGIPVTLFFVYDAYKRGNESKEFLFKKKSLTTKLTPGIKKFEK